MDLKKLFSEYYPDNQQTSTILLQRLLTGLSPSICHQLLLKGKPEFLANATADITGIEYALNFEPRCDKSNVVHQKPVVVRSDESQKATVSD